MAENDPKYFSRKRATTALFFLRNIQARAENSSAIWFILANQDRANQRWCITAQLKVIIFGIVFIPRIVLKLYAHFTILILKANDANWPKTISVRSGGEI